jgi:hypothetical protein
VWNAPEVVRKVGVDGVGMATEHQLLHLYGGLLSVAPSAVGVDFRWKIGFEDRLQHQHRCCHADPVPHGRDAQRSEFAVGFRYEHTPDRLRAVSLVPERKRQFGQPSLGPIRLGVRKILAAHSRSALVGAPNFGAEFGGTRPRTMAMASRIRRASRSDPRLRKALEIIDCEYGTPGAERRPRIRGVPRLGELFLFTPDERVQLRALRDLVERYVARSDPPRPLSLAVFGPPGSGKSFAVKQILKKVEETSRLELSRTDVNLTQISDSTALGKVLARAGRSVNGAVPVIFFDEFDAPREGAPFGWLAWFLAPMQDGEFVSDGEVIQLHRAVYVFAGGTAASLQQFSDFDRLPEFQRAKGPDFISRLRGFLDVCGPNAEPRMLRRAVLFRAEFTSLARRNGAGQFRPDRELMEALLQVGRYRHGARSIAAVVELSNIDERRRLFGWDGLPKDHLLALHIDRGPLDAKLIGGAIAFSGYSESADVADLWRAVAHRLWEEGATLSYAGRWAEGPRGSLMRFLEEELGKRPPEPSAHAHRRRNPDPWLVSFLDNSRNERASVNRAISSNDRNRMGLNVTFAPHLTKEERRLSDRWLSSGLEHFRRRLAVTDASVARFVVAGARTGYYGRFPGVPEEIMLSLAQGKPVYITGAFGGAAADVGPLLGLAHPCRGKIPPSLQAEPKGKEQSLLTIAHELRPGPWTDLPINAAELALFFKAHALGGPKWPDNGLTFDENRRLFASKKRDKVVDLVVTVFGADSPRSRPRRRSNSAREAECCGSARVIRCAAPNDRFGSIVLKNLVLASR